MIHAEHLTLVDHLRDRAIPLKIYHPKIEQVGTVIFSHGLGGSCESYKYIGEYFASHGIKSIHPTHMGIDASLLKEKRPFQLLKEAGENKQNLWNTPHDIKFILNELELENIGMAGHSFGSYTVFALCGQDVSKLGDDMHFRDDRIKCAIAISPHPVVKNPEQAYDEVNLPMLHITGKLDNSPFGYFDPIQRRIPYDAIKAPNQYLMTFEFADHMVFAAQRRGNKFSGKDLTVMKNTCSLSLEFWKKYLLSEDSLLDNPEFIDNINKSGVFERK